ncbi:MAG: AAA family ATPase [Tyzzerella sp.]|nr:AAA family ATPase [Tyzzerella sp.]
MVSLESLKKYARSLGFELRFEMVKPENADKKLPLPIGCSDFRRVCTQYCYVDKTLLIKDILDENITVSLFTRPRRFGKTLNMDMVRVFFEKTDMDTSVYFMDKKIWKCGEVYQEHQGKYPVIFLTFKDVKFTTWEENVAYLKFVFATEFNRHPELFDSCMCNSFEKKYFARVASGEASEMDLTQALFYLTQMLDKHHKVAPIIIIDEYDSPVQQGYMKGYYDQAISFVRSLFSGGFKDNPHLSYGFMTGILRVAKESIFSGLNNLKVNSILENDYSQYFGFTPEEVREMAEYYGVHEKYEEICKWYDGYRFGESHIFNPWSVIGYFNSKCTPKPFWVSTSSNDIIGEVMENATDEIRENLYLLLQGESICTSGDTSVIYPNIKKDSDSVFSFLLVAGYLKIVEITELWNGEVVYKVAVPNMEISAIYRKEILSKLTDVIPYSTGKAIQEAIYRSDVDDLQKQLQKLLIQSVSYNDAANESFYHGFMLGLCAMLDSVYYLSSNREAGEGRFDIQLMPRKKELPGVLIELKSGKKCTKEKLVELANEALRQTELRKYDEGMIMQGIREIVRYGVAFCGKKVEIVMKVGDS